MANEGLLRQPLFFLSGHADEEELVAFRNGVRQGKVMIGFWKRALRIGVASGAFGLPGICASQTCGGVSSIAIARTADLSFGSFAVTGGAGTAAINPSTGARTVSGGLFQVGASGFHPASFNVLLCGDAGLLRFDVVLPSSASLTGSAGGSMTVDAFTSSPSGTGIGGSTVTPTVLNLGATLHVGANQAAGTYSGTFTVTVVRE